MSCNAIRSNKGHDPGRVRSKGIFGAVRRRLWDCDLDKVVGILIPLESLPGQEDTYSIWRRSLSGKEHVFILSPWQETEETQVLLVHIRLWWDSHPHCNITTSSSGRGHWWRGGDSDETLTRLHSLHSSFTGMTPLFFAWTEVRVDDVTHIWVKFWINVQGRWVSRGQFETNNYLDQRPNSVWWL